MSRAVTLARHQLRQLALTHAREALRDRRGMIAMLVTFCGMSVGLTALDLLITLHAGTRPPGVIAGSGVVAGALPLLAIAGFASLAFVSTAVPLTAYRASGVLRQLGTTPVSRALFVLAHAPIRLTLGLVQIVVLLTLAAVFAPVSPATLWRAAALMLSALLFFLAVGYLIGARFRDPDRTMGFAYVLIIVLISTSGTALPLGVLPAPIGSVLAWLPTTLFAQSLSSELLRTPPGFAPFEATVLVLFGLAVVLFALAMRTFRWEPVRVPRRLSSGRGAPRGA